MLVIGATTEAGAEECSCYIGPNGSGIMVSLLGEIFSCPSLCIGENNLLSLNWCIWNYFPVIFLTGIRIDKMVQKLFNYLENQPKI